MCILCCIYIKIGNNNNSIFSLLNDHLLEFEEFEGHHLVELIKLIQKFDYIILITYLIEILRVI
jgi:hypothetical protein